MQKVKFKSYKKKSGTLIPFSIKKDFPIEIKRIFFINGKKNFIRGNHAHKKCSQFLFPISGKIKVECIAKNNEKTIILDYKKKEGYLLKPKTWCEIKFLTNHAILMVACNMEYQFKDYIENYKEFLRFIKKN